MLEITPLLDPNKEEPLYIQLYHYFKQDIQQGNLMPGTKLPSKRKLSVHLGISQNTVETAYQQLLAEGYVESKARKGIYVNTLNEDLFIDHSKISIFSERRNSEQDERYIVDFSHGKIALDEFPYSTWRKLTVQSLDEHHQLLFLNGDRQGDRTLREEMAKYLYQSRGVRCAPEQIIIGAGSQYLVSLLTMIIGRESIFSMEDPGFHRTREAFKDQGVCLRAIPLDDKGMNMEKLKASKANVTYVTPSHQFPKGMVMPISRRMELLKWAEETKSYIIEDDYDGEFRYKGKPIPSLQGLDFNERVIYLGTFSKSLIPSIRISYMVLPFPLLDNYCNRYTIYKQTVSRLHQHTLYQFMKHGHWERHLNKMRTTYRKKQKKLIVSIDKYFGTNGTVIGVDSGLHILLGVDNGMTEQELLETAKTKGVKVYPTSIYFDHYLDIQEPQILLGFAGLSENEIEEGIQLLAEAWVN